MRAWLPALVVISISAACSNEMSVHVRGGDRPPNPEELVFSDDAVGADGLSVNGGVKVERFQIALRSLRLQEAPTDGGADAPGAEYFGPGPYLVDLLAPSLNGGTFTQLVAKYVVGPKSYYEMDINLQPVSASDVLLAPGLAPLEGRTFRIAGTNAQNVPFTFESELSGIARGNKREKKFCATVCGDKSRHPFRRPSRTAIFRVGWRTHSTSVFPG